MHFAYFLSKKTGLLVQNFFIFFILAITCPAMAASPAPPPQLWNLQDADIRSVVQTISELTGKNFVVDPQVQGKMTLVSSQPMSPDQMYHVFLSLLKLHHYVAIKEGMVTKIIPAAQMQKGTAVITLEHADANRLAQVIQALQAAHRADDPSNRVAVIPGPGLHTILVSGYPAHQAAMIELIHDLDHENAATGAMTQQVIPLNYLTAKKIAPLLNKLAAGYVEQEKNRMNNVSFGVLRTPLFSVEAVEDENVIVMSGPHDMIQNLRSVIKKIDTRPQEVLVQAIIVRVDETALSQLGIQWGVGNAPAQGNNNSLDLWSNAFMNGVGYIHHGDFGAIIHALTSSANTDVLATPSVLVLNNQKAVISDGKNIGIYNRSYATQESGTGDSTVPYNTYDRKDVTLSLVVTPQIAPDNTVKLSIIQKDDSLAPDAQSQNPNNPTINTSQINTSVLVSSGDILVLGGLISHNETEVDQKIPFLSRFPLLGYLFTDKLKTKERKNLLVFIRPMIINNNQEASVQSLESYDYIRYQQMRKENKINRVDDVSHPILPEQPSIHSIALPVPWGAE